MAQNEALERKNEILQKKIFDLIKRENTGGLNAQESRLKNRFIKELHHIRYSLK